MLSEKKIRLAGEKIGIELMGFTSAEPLNECLPQLKERKEQKKSTSFERTPPEIRIDYKRAFKEVESIVVIGVPYYQNIPKPQVMKGFGKIASVAWGRDYHQVVMEKINSLGNILIKDEPGFEYRAFVDNSRLVDRGTAWRAGLGFFGKNNTLINPRYGSFFFIGLMLINLKIKHEKIEQMESRCGDCERCLSACPNNALEEGYTLNPERCISYLTQKKKLTLEEEKMLDCYLYGCDLCQLACPYNQNLETTNNFKVTNDRVYPNIDKIIKISDVEFEKTFGNTAAGWRGKETLIRNAEIIKNK
ncbi:MAG: tRNA epoxyqueuosine(34) reductase QueG [Eubacterium sp.]